MYLANRNLPKATHVKSELHTANAVPRKQIHLMILTFTNRNFNFARNHLSEMRIRTNNCHRHTYFGRGTCLRCYSRVPMVSGTPQIEIWRAKMEDLGNGIMSLAFVGNNYKGYLFAEATCRPRIRYQKVPSHIITRAQQRIKRPRPYMLHVYM